MSRFGLRYGATCKRSLLIRIALREIPRSASGSTYTVWSEPEKIRGAARISDQSTYRLAGGIIPFMRRYITICP